MPSTYHTLVGGQKITNVHAETAQCRLVGCAVHNPTDHHMKNWPQHFRDPRVEAATFGLHPGLMERVCEHGVGHPDPDHMRWYRSCHSEIEATTEGIHGCDGCCWPPEDDSPITLSELWERLKTDASDLWQRWVDFTEDYAIPYAVGGDQRNYINKHSLYIDGERNPDYDEDLYGPWEEAAKVEQAAKEFGAYVKETARGLFG
jgi:hypothetical protein